MADTFVSSRKLRRMVGGDLKVQHQSRVDDAHPDAASGISYIVGPRTVAWTPY